MQIKIVCLFTLLISRMVLFGQDEKEILQKHFDAMGQKLWEQVPDVTIDGRWVDENYAGYAIKLSYKPKGKIRIEGMYSNRKFVQATNGLVSWVIAPWKKKYEPMLMDQMEKLILKNSFSPGSPVYDIRDKLHFNGLEDFEGEVYLTFVAEDQHVKQMIYLGRNDYKIYYESFESTEGAFEPVLKVYEKYRSYSGLIIPTAVRFEGKDLEKELIYDEVFVGLGVKDSLFELPKSQ